MNLPFPFFIPTLKSKTDHLEPRGTAVVVCSVSATHPSKNTLRWCSNFPGSTRRVLCGPEPTILSTAISQKPCHTLSTFEWNLITRSARNVFNISVNNLQTMLNVGGKEHRVSPTRVPCGIGREYSLQKVAGFVLVCCNPINSLEFEKLEVNEKN